MGAVQEVCKWRDDEQISESTCRRRYTGTVVGMVRFGFMRTAALLARYLLVAPAGLRTYRRRNGPHSPTG